MKKHGDHFTIFKGIESDILSDGSLDYTDEILKRFDVVIASIHSGMDMNIEKATTRIIKSYRKSTHASWVILQEGCS